MTDHFDDNSRSEMIKYRISKAYEALKEADFCADGKMYVLAINRLYYACYYITTAVLLSHNIPCGTHKGAKVLLNLNFVMKGKLDKTTAKTLATLYDSRQSGDYDDFVFFDAADYESYRPKVVEFIEAVKGLL